MKVAIVFPPDKADKNRFKRRERTAPKAEFDSYPMIAASAATFLKAKGFEVLWVDAATEGWSHKRFISYLKREQPGLIAIQSSTSSIKSSWDAIDDIKAALTGNWNTNIALMGDHVTALPEESFNKSKVDFVLTGGNFDFLLLNLCSQLSLEKSDQSFGLEAGIWYRHGKEIRNTGPFKLNHDLNRLPMVDRSLTKWWLYSYEEPKEDRPSTYSMVARDCGWGQNSFSPNSVLYPDKRFRTRSPDNYLNEIGILISRYGVGEIFDISNTFPSGSWLRSFCQGMISRGYNKSIKVGCRIRLGALTLEDWQLMKEAGFSKIYFTLESANHKTLRKIGSVANTQHLFENVRSAKRAGLETHISVMLGFPWETASELINTVDYVKRFQKDGWADGLEGTIVTPFPGTDFFSECQDRGWLTTDDWDLFDRRKVLLKNSLSDETVYAITESLSHRPVTPRVIYKKLATIEWRVKLTSFVSANRLTKRIMSLLRITDTSNAQEVDEVKERRKSRAGDSK